MSQGTSTSTRGESPLSFGPFRIEADKQLWCGTQPVEIRPRPLALLHYLVERPQQLVTKEELLKRLWPGIYVTKTVLKVCVSEIRQALADDPTTPQFIETVGTQGYRFIGEVVSSQYPVASRRKAGGSYQLPEAAAAPLATSHWQLATSFVGRVQELAVLQAAFARAQRGERQIIFVTGEAGIGKTTLVDRFIDKVRSNEHLRIGRGQCIEQHGGGEAYLPVLEALGQLCRAPGGGQIIALLKRYAPMWLAQLPGLLEAKAFEALQRQVYGSSRERMLRELVEALDIIAAESTVILALEDLQWSDVSTLELLSALAQRRGPARLFVLGTYRSSEVVVSGHPLRRLVHKLHSHGECEEVALELFTEQEVDEYLRRRFPHSPNVWALSSVISSRTDGNALFVVSFVEYLLQNEYLVAGDGQWKVRADTATLRGLIPKTVQRLIAKHVEELDMEEQRLLAIASVVGMTFTAAEVAGVIRRPLEDVEEVYENLANKARFIEVQGLAEWPDHTLTTRYRFRHALVQHVMKERISEVQRVRWHRQLGEWLVAVYGERTREVAGELAVHFEEGREFAQAVQYRQQAGENALRRNAYAEAQQHLTQGLTLLLTQPETQERKRQELRLRIPLGAVLAATRGFVADELEQNQQRARALCREVEETSDLVPVLASLMRLHMVRADRTAIEELMDQEYRLLERLDDPALLLQLHTQLSVAELERGAHASAREHYTQALKLHDPTAHAGLAFSFGVDPAAIVLIFSSLSLWLSGWPDQARGNAERAVVRAQELAHPFTLANVLAYAGWVPLLCGELDRAWALTQTLSALEREHGFTINVTRAPLEQGSVLVQRGELTEGIRLLTEGLAQYRAMGAQALLPYFLSFLADAYKQQGRVDEGLKVIDDALQLTEATFDRFWTAEVYRIKGQLTPQKFQVSSSKFQGEQSPKSKVQGPKSAKTKSQILNSKSQEEAEACFLKAIEIAQQQEAKSLELRAAMSLARLWQSQGKTGEARQQLAEIYGWFTEGFDTKDLQEAKVLLDELV